MSKNEKTPANIFKTCFAVFADFSLFLFLLKFTIIITSMVCDITNKKIIIFYHLSIPNAFGSGILIKFVIWGFLCYPFVDNIKNPIYFKTCR